MANVLASPQARFQLLADAIVVLLGVLLAGVAASGMLLWNRRSPVWVGMAVLVIFRGLRMWMNAGRYVTRPAHIARGASMAAAGLLLLATAFVPFVWVRGMLIAAGAALALGSLAGTFLMLRAE